MSLLFGGKPEEVPLRRQILRVVVFAASKASTIAIISPVFKGDHCSALPSARAYLEQTTRRLWPRPLCLSPHIHP